MVLWELFAIVGLACLILEMVIPTVFFFNLALAGFITAVFSLAINDIISLILIFVAFAILSIIYLRPILIKTKNTKEQETGMKSKYIGKIVKVISPITKNSGSITIYDERWDARTVSDEEIPTGSEVKIIRNESLVMYVEKV